MSLSKEMIDYIEEELNNIIVPESCNREDDISVCEKGKRRFVVIREADEEDLNTECMIQMTGDNVNNK
jgi:hypothetical protein